MKQVRLILNSSDGFLGAKRGHLRRELPWRVPSQGELYESTVENLQWNSQGGSKAMDGERVYTYSPVPGPLPPYSFKLLTVYKNEDVRPGSF